MGMRMRTERIVMVEGPGTPMPENLSPLEWIREGIRRLQAEIECAREHVEGEIDRSDEENDFVNICLHFSSLVEGVNAVSRILIEDLMTDAERGMVVAVLMQKKYGVPMHVEVIKDEVGEVVAVVADPFVVPDTLPEGFGGGGGGLGGDGGGTW